MPELNASPVASLASQFASQPRVSNCKAHNCYYFLCDGETPFRIPSALLILGHMLKEA